MGGEALIAANILSGILKMTTTKSCILILFIAASCRAFSIASTRKRLPLFNQQFTSTTVSTAASATVAAATATAEDKANNYQLTPIFDFTRNNVETKQKSAASFERIDDAIMGGISVSSLRDVSDQDYASWSGVCRTDGGGFCGMRTLPFKDTPLNATRQDGVYLDCSWQVMMRQKEEFGR